MAKNALAPGRYEFTSTVKDWSNVPWSLMGGMMLVNLVLIAFFLTRFLNKTLHVYLYCIIAVLYAILLGCLCLRGTRGFLGPSASALPGRRFSPILSGIQSFIFACSQLLALYSLLIQKRDVPFPSLPYLLIFGVHLCLIPAILLLPEQDLSWQARLRIFLDSLICIVTIAILCFYFVLAPILIESKSTLVEKILAVLYPLADLMTIFCLILVALRCEEQALRPVLIMLGGALLLISVIHIDRLYELLSDHMEWIEPSASVWCIAGTLIVGAAQTVTAIVKQGETGTPRQASKALPGTLFSISNWKSLVPLWLITVVSLGMIVLWLIGGHHLFRAPSTIILIGGFTLLLCLVARQLLSLYEIGILQGKLQRRNRSLCILNDVLEKQVTTDGLTGLPNHRALVAHLAATLARARETSSTCGIIFMDLDYFKGINDTYGHLVGDTILDEWSELARIGIPKNACLGRWGGEEFVAILPDIEPAQVYEIAEGTRKAIEHHLFADELRIHLTCSLGVSTYPYSATCSEDLLMNADRAMYTAKRLGRNQTRIASEPLVLAMGMLAEAPETREEAEMLAVVESLIEALEARDCSTGQHARRVASLSVKLALTLGLDWSRACIIGMGGLLHDLGKVAMPDTILFKRGRLSPVEIEYMMRHSLIGEGILASLPSLREVARIVRSHHEWFDGSGYPDGLEEDAIPLGARIVAVADTYDAIVSHRVYRQGRASTEAASELRKGSGRQFDPRVVHALELLLAASPLALTRIIRE